MHLITRWIRLARANVLFFVIFSNGAFSVDSILQVQLPNQRVNLLESALAAPEALVTMFAEAVKQGNGAVQYTLFCPVLQQQYLPMYQNLNWVTGTSSPSFSEYKLIKVSVTRIW